MNHYTMPSMFAIRRFPVVQRQNRRRWILRIPGPLKNAVVWALAFVLAAVGIWLVTRR